MAKRNLPKRLFKDPDRVSSYHTDGSPTARMKQMSREHFDVLQNIEFALISHHREVPDTDDRIIDEALRAILGGSEPEDPRAQELVDRLAAMRQFREDVADHLWRDGLRVVHDSVKRHSQLRPGEVSYLKFVAQYVR